MSPIGFGWRTGPSSVLDVQGIGAARDMLSEMAARSEDMRPAMLAILHLLVKGNREVFASKGAAIGEAWPGLAPETLARKARSGIPSLSSEMVESGDLEASLSGGRGGRKRATRSSASAGTSLFYALFHLKQRADGMPARPPLGISEETELESMTVLEWYLMWGGI